MSTYRLKKLLLLNLLGGKCAGYPPGYVCAVSDHQLLSCDHIHPENFKGQDNDRRHHGDKLVTFALKHPKWAKRELQFLCKKCNERKTRADNARRAEIQRLRASREYDANGIYCDEYEEFEQRELSCNQMDLFL